MTTSWIFSKKEDLMMVFIITVLGVFYINPALYGLHISAMDFVPLALFFQAVHAIAVLFVAYYNPDKKLNEKKFYFITPPIIILFSFLVFLEYGSDFILRFTALVALAHFIRQQYGVLMIPLRKGVRLTNVEAKLNQLFFYNSTLTPVIYFLSHPKFELMWNGFSFQNRLVEFNSIIFYIFISIFLLNVLWEIIEFKKYGKLNTPKIIHTLHSYLIWFGIPYFSNAWYNALNMLIVHHSLYSWYLCFKRVESWDVKNSKLFNFVYKKRLPVLKGYIITFAISFVYAMSIHKSDFFSFRLFFNPEIIFPMSLILITSDTWIHFLFDASIWKKKNRPQNINIT